MGADLLFHAIIHGNTQDAVALLEDNEVDLHARNVNGLTPLHVGSSLTLKYAVEIGHLTFVEMLLKYGSMPNIQEYHEIGGATPLYRACEKNYLEVRGVDCRWLSYYCSLERIRRSLIKMDSLVSMWRPDTATSI